MLITNVQLRLLYVLPAFNPTRPRLRTKGQPTRLLIVLGSGGHTAEMFSLLQGLNANLYTHRTYVISSGDDFSATKAMEFENTLGAGREENRRELSPVPSTFDISFVPRARKIHQSLLTTPISSLRCLFACFGILFAPSTQRSTNSDVDGVHPQVVMEGKSISYTYPDLIIANGPATAVLLIASALLLRFCNLRGTEGKMRTIYIESWARVSTLSLSGKILMTGGMVNRMLVQWEILAQRGGGEFRGALVR
ncbi:MAG: hypothetical protein Q9188_004392 [Gyalolechia gomerana]